MESKFLQLKTNRKYSTEELKDFIKRLKSDMKITAKKGVRKVRVFELLDINSTYEYSRILHQDFKNKFEQEKLRASEFLNNETEIEKAGWNYQGGKKSVLSENSKKQIEWADKAYPSFKPELWESEVDLELSIHLLKRV